MKDSEQIIKSIVNWLKEKIVKCEDSIRKDENNEKPFLNSWKHAYEETLKQLVKEGVVIEMDLVLRQEAERLTHLMTLDFTNHELCGALHWQRDANNKKDYISLIYAESKLRKWVAKGRLETAKNYE